MTQALALPAALPGVAAIALVGSWARNAARDDSDIDFVVLTNQPSFALNTSSWTSVFGDDVNAVRTAGFGAIQERRLRLTNGLVIEVGIARPSWADANPLDAGTERVVRDGLVRLYDPDGLLATLLDAIAKR